VGLEVEPSGKRERTEEIELSVFYELLSVHNPKFVANITAWIAGRWNFFLGAQEAAMAFNGKPSTISVVKPPSNGR
jgi:hypothetical protein